MTKKVIDVGQCNLDNGNIGRLLKGTFGAEVLRAHSHDEALAMAAEHQPALVLINRLYDADGSEGMETVRAIKADEAMSGIPVMIVSNFADAQTAAVEAGAVHGFGKSALNDPATVTLLGEFLA